MARPKGTTKIEMDSRRAERRKIAESSLVEFIQLIHSNRLLGNIHREVINWWTSSAASTHQLLMLPRDHMKSALIAYRVAWALTRNPALRILYISSTRNLAIKQLKFIKDILTSDIYRLYWPEMVNKEEAKREKWTESEISVDHPKRKEEHIRDPSIFTAGLTSNIVGMHCDIAVLDDVVVSNNAYLEEARTKVREQYGALASIEGSDALEWVVGTRYHPKDLYSTILEMEVESYDELGNVTERTRLFDVKEYPVENVGDGTGEFLWPRQQRADGQWFGFDSRILAFKKSKYDNKLHFRAQYYNDPHDSDNSPISRHLFQYYDQAFLNKRDGQWYFKGNRLNVVASVDFAYSTSKDADYSCIVVLGADSDRNYYIMEIDRFKTANPSEYFKRILKVYEKWGFRKIRAEVSVAQQVIVNDLKENYIKPLGLGLSVDEYRPTRNQGNKEERIFTILEPAYANQQIYHYPGGNTQALEEELLFANPAHDDIKDALASAIDFILPPVNSFRRPKEAQSVYQFHSRYGGVA
jgi:phage terminase large subunit-like protein